MLLKSAIRKLLGFIIITHTGFSQPHSIRFQHLSVDQGLSQSEVYAVTQDKYGFMWMATRDGLNRFDGRNVEVYRIKLGDKNSLPNNGVFTLFNDSRGILWIGTANGLAYYNERTNSFRSFFMNPKDENSLPGNFISVINEDSRGVLWIGTPQGLCSFDVKKNRFQRFVHDDHSNSISNNQVQDIEFTPDGAMWITTFKGLNRLDLSTMKFTAFFHDPADSSTLSGNSLLKLAMDKNGNLWICLSTFNKPHLDFFNTKTYRCKRYTTFIEKQSTIATNFLLSLLIDKDGRLWIGSTESGLSLFFPDRNSFHEYKVDPLNPASLQSNTIIGMCQDRSGMIWLGTTSGVARFNPDESKFILYRSQTFLPNSLDHKTVQAFEEDSLHRLWIGTSDGLFILDRKTGKFSHYKWKQSDSNSLSVNHINSICRDRLGNMWIGTAYGLNLFDEANNKFRAFYFGKDNRSSTSNNITNIVNARNGDLLITTNYGLSLYDSKTGQFVNYKGDTARSILYENKRMNVIFEDSRGILWIGFRDHGLIRFDRQTGKLEQFIKIRNDTTSLPANYVGSITQDHKGIIWIGTGAGLCWFNESTRTFTILTDKNGLPNPRVKQLLVDDRDRIWMGTNRGISMLDESRTRFTNYDPSDGLQGWEFSEPSAFKTYDGYFCFGGKYGFNMFHPDSIKKNTYVPPVVLERITIFDQPLKTDSTYSKLKSLRLSYKQNFFSFEFAALNYDHPEKNRYACQLVGFDKKMVQLGTNNTISYTNVPPANYKLIVKASNNDDTWNEAGYELDLIITPPFWATWWFRTIMVALFIGAVFLFFKLRENRIRKEQARQTAINKQIAEIRMIALRSQMNPHFIFNSLNSIQHFITIRQKEEAINYLSKFSKLIRKILENSRENTVSISNELQLLELFIQLEQLRFNHKFDYHIEVDEKIDKENTEIPPLLIQPYVENAILHGLINKDGKGDLWFSMEKDNGSLICKIEDNGIGRARAQEIQEKKSSRHKSLGIKVTNERISTLSSLLDYKMEVLIEDLFETNEASEQTSQPAGTRVTITIPVKEED